MSRRAAVTARVSPRTDAEPMAFTGEEFVRGAIVAWLWYLGVSTLLFTVLGGGYGWIGLIYSGPWSFGALVLASPLAFALGRALRRVVSVPTHLVAFTAFGAAIGLATTVLAMVSPWLGGDMSFVGVTPYFLGINIVCSALAVALGWWHTAKRALRRDRGVVRVDPDAAWEDAADRR